MDTSIMIPNRPTHHLQRGLTLTEILVALVISTILMAGVFTIMSSSKRTYALQNELSELQENARFVMDEFSWEIRMAGYLGCSSVISNPFGGGLNDEVLQDKHGNNFPHSDMLVITSFGEQIIPAANESFEDDTIELDARSLIPAAGEQITMNDCAGSRVYEVESYNPGDNSIKIKTLTPPDTVYAIRKFNGPVAIFTGSNVLGKQKVTKNNDIIPDPTGEWIELGTSDPLPDACDIITIADGQGSHSYLVTEVNGQQLTLRPPPRQFNNPVTFIYRGSDAATVYKVDKMKNEDKEEEEGFALYKCRGVCGCGEEPEDIFLEGVENMQVRYGLDTDNDSIPNLYSTAPTIPGYTTVTKVNSIRFTLLMRTLQKRSDLEGATDKNFRLDSALTDDTDGIYNPQTDNAALESGYRHRLFTSTIKVRN